MKSSLDTKTGLTRKLTIQIPSEKVSETFNRLYTGIQKKAAIKGFRKGKAPIATIKSLYGEDVHRDAVQDLVSSAYQNALQEHTLDPIGYPDIHFDKLDESGDFEFTAEFEIRPEVKINKFEGLKIQKEKFEIKPDQIDTVLDNIRASRKETSPVLEDRPAQMEDIATLDFEGTMDNAPLPGGSGQDHKLELGTNSFIPGFEEGIVGMKIGATKELHLSFPEDYHATEIAGKAVQFVVTLKTLEKSSLPEINDELAEKVGGFKTLDELREAIKEDLVIGEEGRIKEDTRNRILKALVKENPVAVPKALHAQQKEMLIKDVHGKMKQQGMSEDQFEEYTDKWGGDFDESASFMIQSSFLVDALAIEQNLKANDADIKLKISQYAEETGMEIAKLNEFYGDADKKANLRYQLTEEKVVDFLISKANITEVAKDKLKE